MADMAGGGDTSSTTLGLPQPRSKGHTLTTHTKVLMLSPLLGGDTVHVANMAEELAQRS